MATREIDMPADAVLSTLPAANPDYSESVVAQLRARRSALTAADEQFEGRAVALAGIASEIIATLRSGGKVLVAGNGGSAAEAQHFAGELVGRFLMEREPYAAIALCVDSAVVTAIGNDYGFDDVFARQVRGLGRPGDLFMAISTSGSSPNLLRAAEAAKETGLTVVAITGDRPSPLERLADRALRAPATSTPLIQELQMTVTHILCGIVEGELAGESSAADGECV